MPTGSSIGGRAILSYDRRRREQTPLLHEEGTDQQRYHHAESTPPPKQQQHQQRSGGNKRRGIIRGIFGGGGGRGNSSSNPSTTPQSHHTSSSWSIDATRNHKTQYQMDTRPIPVPKLQPEQSPIRRLSGKMRRSQSSSNDEGSDNDSDYCRDFPPASAQKRQQFLRPAQSSLPPQHQQNSVSAPDDTPPHLVRRGALAENARDSHKKDRPFNFPVRRFQKRNDAMDPPERGPGPIFADGGGEEKQHRMIDQSGFPDDEGNQEPLEVLLNDSPQEDGKVQHLSPISTSVLMRSDIANYYHNAADTGETTARGTRTATQPRRQQGDEEIEAVFSASFFSPKNLQSSSESTLFRSLPPTPALNNDGDRANDGDWQKVKADDTKPKHPSSGGPAATQQQQARTLKQVLSRPFGRDGLPPIVARRIVAEVGNPEWDQKLQKHKYRILVQRRKLEELNMHLGSPKRSKGDAQASSFTTAYTYRTFADFQWLEESLNREFHGALLLPMLDKIVSDNNDRNATAQVKRPIPASDLRDWLNDILNGVRGNGELILEFSPQTFASIMQSESFETFFYKNDLPTADGASKRRGEGEAMGSGPRTTPSSILFSLFSKPLEFCVGPEPDWVENKTNSTWTPTQKDQRTPDINQSCIPNGRGGKSLPMDMLASCSASRAQLYTDGGCSVMDDSTIGDDYDQDQMARSRQHQLYQHASQLVLAEAELALNYRKTAVFVLDKLNAVTSDEELIAQYWRKFATAIINLFSYEKEVENKNFLGGTVKKESMPYRKVSKDRVDESVQTLAKSKAERSLPALSVLGDMLKAYSADLHAVQPAVDAYKDATAAAYAPLVRNGSSESTDCDYEDDESSESRDNRRSRRTAHRVRSWEERIKTLAASVDDAVKKHAPGGGPGELRGKYSNDYSEQHQQKLLQQRLQANEQLLRHSLTSLCRATPIRVARMAWRHWSTEACQCASINTAAVSLKAKVDVASKDSVTKMVERHFQEEEEDNAKELDLITRIVNIQKNKKFGDSANAHTGEVEVGDDAITEERAKASRRAKALDIAQDRIGRWDSKLSIAIMEAVEVEDPNVRVEETSRELRLVRKYAIGLREQVNRCIEAIRLLRGMYSESETKSVVEKRRELLREMAKLFSGKLVVDGSVPKRSSPSMTVLARAGVDTSDPFGWGTASKVQRDPTFNTVHESPRSSHSSTGRVGELAVAYFHTRDAHTEWLLKNMYDLLTDYFDRVAEIECFVYMECVGMQLERHFSQRRANALTAFEKKTDITTALNVAKRKRLTKLVLELQEKLDQLGPDVSHTIVKETKETHLESKNLKSELHDLAMRRLNRAREVSTERAVNLLSLWAKEEENAATSELKALGEAMAALERAVGNVSYDFLLHRVSQEIKSSPRVSASSSRKTFKK